MQSIIIRGWRGRLQEAYMEAQRAVWEAPSVTHNFDIGAVAPKFGRSDQGQWFCLQFDSRRTEARTLRRRIQLLMLGALPECIAGEDHPDKLMLRRLRYALWSEERKARESDKAKKRRAKFDPERKALEAAAKKRRRLAKPELYREIEARAAAKNRDAKNARRRAAYAENPEKHRARTHAYRARTAASKAVQPTT